MTDTQPVLTFDADSAGDGELMCSALALRAMSSLDLLLACLGDPRVVPVDEPDGETDARGAANGLSVADQSPVVPVDEPLARCNACQRLSWSPGIVDSECEMEQPDGSMCRGYFVALGAVEAAPVDEPDSYSTTSIGTPVDEPCPKDCPLIHGAGPCPMCAHNRPPVVPVDDEPRNPYWPHNDFPPYVDDVLMDHKARAWDAGFAAGRAAERAAIQAAADTAGLSNVVAMVLARSVSPASNQEDTDGDR